MACLKRREWHARRRGSPRLWPRVLQLGLGFQKRRSVAKHKDEKSAGVKLWAWAPPHWSHAFTPGFLGTNGKVDFVVTGRDLAAEGAFPLFVDASVTSEHVLQVHDIPEHSDQGATFRTLVRWLLELEALGWASRFDWRIGPALDGGRQREVCFGPKIGAEARGWISAWLSFRKWPSIGDRRPECKCRLVLPLTKRQHPFVIQEIAFTGQLDI